MVVKIEQESQTTMADFRDRAAGLKSPGTKDRPVLSGLAKGEFDQTGRAALRSREKSKTAQAAKVDADACESTRALKM